MEQKSKFQTGKLVATGLFIFLTVNLVGAGPATAIVDRIRAGNLAFEQNDLPAALSYYELAEEKTTDPGLVARNKGVVLYLEGRYREAELAFRCALENAPRQRRGECLFGLANCLLLQADSANLTMLRDAIRCLDMCRRSNDLSETLRAKAEHNLELGRLMLRKAELEVKTNPQPPSPPPNTANNKTSKNSPKEKEKPGSGETKGKSASSGEKTNHTQGRKENASEDSLPGAGKLPTLKDTDQLSSLSEEDVHRLLQQAVERIREQRRQEWGNQRMPGNSVKDW